ncbi:MAG: hypothetical protein ACRCVW_03745 [Brevinema sp.]
MKNIFVLLIFVFISGCSVLAQKVTVGKSMPSNLIGYYDPIPLKSDIFRDYIKIDEQGLYVKKIGFEYKIENGMCVGDPIVADGVLYHLKDILTQTSTTFTGLFRNALSSTDDLTYVFSMKKKPFSKTEYEFILPIALNDGNTVAKAIANAITKKYTFYNTKQPEASMCRKPIDPDADRGPFLEKLITKPGENGRMPRGFWEITPQAAAFTKGLMALVGMGAGSKAIIFSEPVTNSRGELFLWKQPENHDPLTPPKGLPVYGFAYHDKDPLDKPRYPIHYTPENYKYGTFYFQGNKILGGKNVYLPVMVAGDNVIGGPVRIGKPTDKSSWNMFVEKTIPHLMTYNIIAIRVQESSSRTEIPANMDEFVTKAIEHLEKNNVAQK